MTSIETGDGGKGKRDGEMESGWVGGGEKRDARCHNVLTSAP